MSAHQHLALQARLARTDWEHLGGDLRPYIFAIWEAVEGAPKDTIDVDILHDPDTKTAHLYTRVFVTRAAPAIHSSPLPFHAGRTHHPDPWCHALQILHEHQAGVPDLPRFDPGWRNQTHYAYFATPNHRVRALFPGGSWTGKMPMARLSCRLLPPHPS